MMKVLRRLLSQIMPLLIAGAFMAFPASAAPDCDPHEHQASSFMHMELHDHEDAGSQDPASHEHGLHVHGNCHVPMTEPVAFEFSALIATDNAPWSFYDLQAHSGTSVALDRPPKA